MGDDIKLQLIFFLGLGPGVIFFFERGNYRGRDLDSLIYVLQVFLKGCSIVRFDRYIIFIQFFEGIFVLIYALSLPRIFTSIFLYYRRHFFLSLEIGQKLSKNGQQKLV